MSRSDIPDNYFRGIDEGLTQDELDRLAVKGKDKAFGFGSNVMNNYIDEIFTDMLRIYGRNLTPEVLGRECVRMYRLADRDYLSSSGHKYK